MAKEFKNLSDETWQRLFDAYKQGASVTTCVTAFGVGHKRIKAKLTEVGIIRLNDFRSQKDEKAARLRVLGKTGRFANLDFFKK